MISPIAFEQSEKIQIRTYEEKTIYLSQNNVLLSIKRRWYIRHLYARPTLHSIIYKFNLPFY